MKPEAIIRDKANWIIGGIENAILDGHEEYYGRLPSYTYARQELLKRDLKIEEYDIPDDEAIVDELVLEVYYEIIEDAPNLQNIRFVGKKTLKGLIKDEVCRILREDC